METIIAELIQSTGLTSSRELVDKTKEYLRKLQSKLPMGSLGKGERCRTVLALEIACRQTDTHFERKQLLKNSSIADSDYQKALATCKAALEITQNFVNAAQVLALQYDQELVDHIKPILNQYQKLYVDKLPTSSRSYVKLDAPLYVCAAFLLAADTKKIKVDKAAICRLSETTPAKLVALAAEMKKILEAGAEPSAPGVAAAPPTGNAPRGRKQLQAYVDSTAATAGSSAATAGAAGAAGVVRPLHEVRQTALQDLSRAQALDRANARNGTAALSSGFGSSSSNNVDDSMKAGLKRNLAAMQHVLPASGVENASSTSNSSRVNTSSTDPVVAAALAARQAAEAAAREKREAYEAWRDSMKRAKLSR